MRSDLDHPEGHLLSIKGRKKIHMVYDVKEEMTAMRKIKAKYNGYLKVENIFSWEAGNIRRKEALERRLL